ncbi:MAG: AAA family ATPase, partial [Candidatus Hydrothermarchaeales archaeon]
DLPLIYFLMVCNATFNMALKIAVAGKGGVGKTTIAGALARLYARDGNNVIAVDADPDSNLASALDISKAEREKIIPLSQMYDLIEERTGVRPGESFGGMFKLNPKVNDLLERYGLQGKDGVVLLVLGTIQNAASGCFCPENALLKGLMRHLLLKKDDVLIMDMEAGIEHLGRGTAEKVDLLLVVVEPGQRSLETAAKVKELGSQLGIDGIGALLNKMRSTEEKEIVGQALKEIGIPLLGTIPYDESTAKSDLEGKALELRDDSELTSALRSAMETLTSFA